MRLMTWIKKLPRVAIPNQTMSEIVSSLMLEAEEYIAHRGRSVPSSQTLVGEAFCYGDIKLPSGRIRTKAVPIVKEKKPISVMGNVNKIVDGPKMVKVFYPVTLVYSPAPALLWKLLGGEKPVLVWLGHDELVYYETTKVIAAATLLKELRDVVRVEEEKLAVLVEAKSSRFDQIDPLP